ncbi:hypothetical protein DYB31_004233 [Aphanomyces astaci]|uniref:FH2 domain-containing protein n=3 Tax=Aphanomyces astaci TaxID=112090 RepID=A0A397FCL2_APHAT|nr:hypothetical protein DYB31_004233 [Aphanomyces astaci]
MNQLRKLASYVVESSLKPSASSAPPSPHTAPVPSYKHLDLTYVTTRLLVSGHAIDGPTDKKSCVNNAGEMKSYLDAAHAGKYVVFNLNAESADTAVISPQTLDFSWERDGGIRTYTPPSDHIFRICYAIFAWLALDAENVALLYCHNGKTRSGVICACYFLFVRTVDDPMSALAQFYQKRLGIDTLTPEYVKKSMPISIQRFVSNFSTIMNTQAIPNPEPLVLKAIMFRALPVEMAPLVQLWDDHKMVFSSASNDSSKPVMDWNPEDGFLAILWETGIPLDGGFTILCSFGDDYDGADNDGSSPPDPASRVLFRYMNSTWFLHSGLVTLQKPMLDMIKQYEHGFDLDNFSVDMVFHDSLDPPKPTVPVDYTGNYAVKQGIVEMASHHTTAPDPSMYINFVKNGFDATASTFALQRAQNAPNVALDILHSEGISTIFTRLLPLHPSPLKAAAAGKPFTFPRDLCADDAPLSGGIVRSHHGGPRRHSLDATRAPSISVPSVQPVVKFEDAVCAVCREEDYVLRPQLVRCNVASCRRYFHTTCAGLKKIPFGLTTMSDRANHAAYMKKFFGAWECADCQAASRQSKAADTTTVAIADSPSKTSPTKQKLEKLRLLLDEKGLSLDDLLQAADAKDTSATPQVQLPLASAVDKYQRMADNGVPREAVHNCMVRDGVSDPSDLLQHVKPKARSNAVAENTTAASSQPDVLLLRHAIQFHGYFEMLQKGCSKDAVKHKMKMCGLNPDILDLNPNAIYVDVRDQIEALQTQYSQPKASPHKPDAGSPVKPVGASTTPPSPQQSQAQSSVILPTLPLKQEEEPETAPVPDVDSPKASGKLQDDATYAKYFKMLRLNIPEEAVRLKMKEHGVNLKALELGPDGLVSDLTTAEPVKAEAPLLKDDPVYGKYFKMLKMHIPEGAVRQKMIEHGVNLKALELGPDGLVSDLTTAEPAKAEAPLLKDDPVYGKYFKMLKMHIPEGAVRQKMIEHGVNLKALELGPDGLVSDLTTAEPAKAEAPLLKDDPVYGKYFKMLKMHIPEGAVRQKMIEHGVNLKALELGPDGLVSDLMVKALLKDDPVYAKYFKMLKMHIPEGAVKQKMIEHGANPKALELGPDGLVSDLTAGSTSPPKPVKKVIRRKKLFWQALPEDRLKRASSTIWEDEDHHIQLDMDEIETLFFKDTAKATLTSGAQKPLARKQAVTLVDGKRAMNAAIALARIKLSYADVAKAIDTFDAMGLTLEQLTTINEFLPTSEEVRVVQRYTGDPAVLGEAEKFFAAISTVPRFATKMECLISKQAFGSHVAEVTTSLHNVIKACEDVKESRLLKLLLGTVLKLGNTLNGGEETEHAIRGFSVDSLLRLGHTKTNDQKTTVLHYLVRVLRKNQPHVLEFQSELQHVSLAAREAIESIDQMYAALDADVKKTADECRHMQTADPAVIASFQAAIAHATHELEIVQRHIGDMKHQLTTVFEYFGEDPTKKPSEFFQTLSSFCLAFEKAKQQVEAADQAKERAERNTSSSKTRPRASTLLHPAEKAKLMMAKNSFSFKHNNAHKLVPTTTMTAKASSSTTSADLDRTASSRF